VLNNNPSRRSIFYVGPYAGMFLGGSYKIEGTTDNIAANNSTVSVSGNLAPGTTDSNTDSDNTQFYRPFEIGAQAGFRFQASSNLMLGPDFKYGISDIFPRSKDSAGTLSGKLPEIRSTSIHFVLTITL
jgi:hypothetical protein